jgi:peptide/nickel transport system substrate-binding protein
MTKIMFFLLPLVFLASLASAQEPTEPRRGGEVSVAITADPPGWDPSISTSQEIPRVVYHNVLEGLVRFDRKGKIVPALAEGWTTSNSGLTWTFQIRRNVKFHDGSDLSLGDIVAKFDRARDPDSGHTHQDYYAAIETITSNEASHTVTFRLSHRSSSLLYNLARPDSVISPADKVDTQRITPIGTGPFRFTSYIEGSEVRLERFENYYIDGVPYLDAVTFRIIGDPNTRFAALRAGDIDMIAVALSPEQCLQIRSEPDLRCTEGTATTEITLAMNNSRGALADKRVRQAITHAIDKNSIVKGAMFGLGTVIGTHMSPAESYYIDLSNTYPYDPARARQLLAEAGYTEGELTISFELPEPYNIERRSGQVIAQQLSDVGINVELSIVEWGTWIQRIFLGSDYDMTIIGHSEPRDINIYANPNYYYNYDNPVIGELLKVAEAAEDYASQVEAYQTIARIIAEDAVNVWIFSPPYLVATTNHVKGFWENQPTPSINMTEVYRTR